MHENDKARIGGKRLYEVAAAIFLDPVAGVASFFPLEIWCLHLQELLFEQIRGFIHSSNLSNSEHSLH
jgi:hypothetical protein